MLHGEQRNAVDLSFAIPAECAKTIEQGNALIGLVPVVEVARQGLEIVPGVGITCNGPVRSIVLVSKVPWLKIKNLAVDVSSRTSVILAQIILREKYGIEPQLIPLKPSLPEMLQQADAALIIGDPALALDPAHLPFEVMDLGEVWHSLTNLPMVFAVWAGKPSLPIEALRQILLGSYAFGKSQIDEIVAQEHKKRNITPDLARAYITSYIQYEVGPLQQKGMTAFLTLASRFGYLPERISNNPAVAELPLATKS